jgi:hypothetical protein
MDKKYEMKISYRPLTSDYAEQPATLCISRHRWQP